MNRPRPHAPELVLVIGDRRLSSWSLRAWLALRATGYPFAARTIRLDRPDTRARIAEASPSAKVPVLLDGELAVWDSLAICETLAEWFPAARLWPADPAARAHARAIASEMHSSFADLRREMPMDLALRTVKEPSPAVRRDIDRVCALWGEYRRRFDDGGNMLFGT